MKFFNLNDALAIIETIVTNKATMENVSNAFSTIYDLQHAVQHDVEELTAIKGVGPKTRDKIVKALWDKFTTKLNYKIMHYDFLSEKVHVELHHTNMGFLETSMAGVDPEIMYLYVDSLMKWDDNNAHIRWINALSKGIFVDGRKYLPFCATASGAKKAQSIWVLAEYVVACGRTNRKDFVMNNAEMEPAKFFTRLGLYMSSCDPIETIYSNFKLDTSKIALVKDVKKNGANRTDGLALIDGGKEAFQTRPEKTCTIPVNFKKLVKIVGDVDLEQVYGGTRKLSTTGYLMFESCHKWSSICKSDEEFKNSVAKYGIHICHTFPGSKIKWKNVVYQAMQTLPLSEDNLTALEAHAANYLDNMKNINGFIALLPKEMRQSVAMYPALANDAFVLGTAQKSYNKQRMTLRGGAVPHVGGFYVICSDYVDILSEGKIHLEAGECCIKSLPAGPMLFIRYPHTSEASWVVLINHPEYANAILDRNVLMINNYDDTLRRLGGADFDGDKVLIITNEMVKDILMNCIENMGPVTMPAALEGKAKKVKFTAKTSQDIKIDYFSKLTQMSQIGSYSNKLSAAYAAYFAATTDEDRAKYRSFIEYYQLMVEVVVDREKHGNTYVQKPEGIDEFEALMPKFIQYAKLAKKMENDEKRVIPHPENYTRIDCPMERYSEWIDANTTRSSEFCVEADEFSYRKLMFDGELAEIRTRWFNRGEKQKAPDGTDIYVGQGVFDKIVFAKSDELRKFAESAGVVGDTVRDLKTNLMAWFIDEYAKRFNYSERDVYNLIVWYVFNMADTNCSRAYKRVFWETLHTWAEEALTECFGSEAIKFDAAIVDDLDDDEDSDENLGI